MKGKAVLYLQDGTFAEGSYLGLKGETIGEVVFNTSMTGYEEIISDPSYCGQIVLMCYPQIGNYGISIEDSQGYGAWARGLVIKEYSKAYSNWQAKMSLDEYLCGQGLTAIEGIDTRYIVRKIRKRGAMKGIISAEDFSPSSLKKKLDMVPSLEGRDLVAEVNASENSAFKNYKPESGDLKVAVLDYGVKRSIIKNLKSCGLEPVLLPADSSLEDVLGIDPSGVVLSNGPGDPAAVKYAIELARELIEYNKKKRLPVLGICLGNQIIALAAGARTYKLKFGHHGGNHPVKNLKTGRIEITVQNHGFAVDPDTMPEEFELSHINLNDNTVEGLRHRDLPVVSYQNHPEAGPGPGDSQYIFKEFKELINACKN
ncbi:MAG: glutamine-hydrolyzing carbamoyl-phosphate synthase small subunit [Elusimicrobiota bacterium]